jgi:hypothetical protein
MEDAAVDAKRRAGGEAREVCTMALLVRSGKIGAAAEEENLYTEANSMPRIAEFYGITIYMYFSDHVPPHFHAIYGRYDAEVEISSGDVHKGRLPSRAHRLVREWSQLFRRELEENWTLARDHQPLRQIPPLE